MAPFDELQKLWQNQAPPAAAIDGIALTRDLAAFARRQCRILIAKSIIVAAVLTWSAILNLGSALRLAGLLVIGVSAFSLIGADWRKQRQLASPPFARALSGFPPQNARDVLGLRDPYQGYDRALLIATIIGLNLISLAARQIPCRSASSWTWHRPPWSSSSTMPGSASGAGGTRGSASSAAWTSPLLENRSL
jgi:hypothetical protein